MNGSEARKKSLLSMPRSAEAPPQIQAVAQNIESRNQTRAHMPKIYHILLLMVLTLPAFAQEAAMPNIWTQLGDSLGAPCAGCFLYQFAAGGTMPQNTYTTPSGGVANNNPLQLDAAGQANIWLTPGQTYRFDLYSATNTLIRTVDNIPGGTLLGQSTVTANYVLAGPTTGAAATPIFRALVAADFAALFTATTCTNQAVTALTTSLVGTCSTLTGSYFGSSIAARSALVRAAASTGAPAFGTTIDALAYQIAEIPSFVFVSTDFTTSGVGTALELITGLSFTIPASTALNVPFACYFTYSQAVANDAVAFGIQDVTVSPTNIAARGDIRTSTTASTAGNLATLTTTTATVIVSATPGATATNYMAEISGFIEAPSNASSSQIRIMVSTATAADLVTIRRGSHCRMN